MWRIYPNIFLLLQKIKSKISNHYFYTWDSFSVIFEKQLERYIAGRLKANRTLPLRKGEGYILSNIFVVETNGFTYVISVSRRRNYIL